MINLLQLQQYPVLVVLLNLVPTYTTVFSSTRYNTCIQQYTYACTCTWIFSLRILKNGVPYLSETQVFCCTRVRTAQDSSRNNIPQCLCRSTAFWITDRDFVTICWNSCNSWLPCCNKDPFSKVVSDVNTETRALNSLNSIRLEFSKLCRSEARL